MSDEPLTSSALELTPTTIAEFIPERILSESTLSGSTFILGTLGADSAIIHIQKTAIVGEAAENAIKNLQEVKLILENSPYYLTHAWVRSDPSHPDFTIKIICPATLDHVNKYSTQQSSVVRETAQIYHDVVVPYIESLPVSKIQWVYEILEGRKEADRVYFHKTGDDGFVILPDLKWDEVNMNSLYFVAIVENRDIKSLRDLKKEHIPMLEDIRGQAVRIAKERFDVGEEELRMFVHYHPTYYHFHVHVVHIRNGQLLGQVVGQAHHLDDIISLLDLSHDHGPTLLAQKSFTYTLGVQHALYAHMLQAGAVLGSSTAPAELVVRPPSTTPVEPSIPSPTLDPADTSLASADSPPAKRLRI